MIICTQADTHVLLVTGEEQEEEEEGEGSGGGGGGGGECSRRSIDSTRTSTTTTTVIPSLSPHEQSPPPCYCTLMPRSFLPPRLLISTPACLPCVLSAVTHMLSPTGSFLFTKESILKQTLHCKSSFGCCIVLHPKAKERVRSRLSTLMTRGGCLFHFP